MKAAEKFSKRHGKCLCGSVSFVAEKASNKVAACHCGMCRRHASGPALAVFCGTDVTFQGKDFISIYSSSKWGERGFCKNCGSRLFFRVKGKNVYIMGAGLFEEHEDFAFESQIFIDDKPGYYDFKNETEKLTGAQIAAKYA